jgi:predicted ATP-binding protein involved in virulence
MIAWTVDLASRLFASYPESQNPLAEPAVVLVDEVDLHLHPKWQRELRSHLTERFPGTQFVVTAHSPLVVQDLRKRKHRRAAARG